jgi:galactokinase
MSERPRLAQVERARRAFMARYGGQPALVAWGPGRVNVIGEHTDYNGGLAMPAAIDREVAVAMRPRRDRRVEVWSEDFGDALSVEWGAIPARPSIWKRYVLGALALIAEVAHPGHGWEGVVAGDVPVGAGLSSSAAIEMALLGGLRQLYAPDLSDLDLVRLGQRIEHEHLGLHSGLLDQLASRLSREGHLLVLDFRDLSHRYVPATLDGWTWVVIDSGVRRELARSAYDERVRECAAGLGAIRARDPAVQHFRDIRAEHLAEAPADATWPDRLCHVLEENARVRETEAALRRGDLGEVGTLLLQSHASLRVRYAVSCAELDTLVLLAMARPGCIGARMVGGGFGGCTLNLVRTEAAADLIAAVRSDYASKTKRQAQAWRFAFVGGAGVVPC